MINILKSENILKSIKQRKGPYCIKFCLKEFEVKTKKNIPKKGSVAQLLQTQVGV